VADLMTRAAAEGAVRRDVLAGAVMVVLHGIGSMADRTNWPALARASVELLINGIKPGLAAQLFAERGRLASAASPDVFRPVELKRSTAALVESRAPASMAGQVRGSARGIPKLILRVRFPSAAAS
jgi:hypothetical protein